MIDFKAQPLDVATGPSTTTTLDFDGADGDLVRAQGYLTIDLFGFVYLTGYFAFETKTVTQTVDDVTTSYDQLTVGAADAYVFAGIGGPYWTDSNHDGVVTADDEPAADGAIGIAIGGVDIGLAILTNQEEGSTVRYLGLKISAASAALVGVESLLTVQANDVTVELNQATDEASTVTPAVLDFSAFDGGGLSVLTGGDPVTLDFDHALLRVTIGDAVVQISSFIYVRGAFALEKGVQLSVDNGDSTTTDLDVLTLGAATSSPASAARIGWTRTTTA